MKKPSGKPKDGKREFPPGQQPDRLNGADAIRLVTYHYTDSGLDNVYLIDGYTRHNTPYGKGVSIQNLAGLHRAIGQWLIKQPRPLNGAELRFIRTEMELTQRALAAIIGTEEQTLRLWEKGRDRFMPGTAERLLRAVYAEFLGNNLHILRMLEKLADRDRIEGGNVCFTKKNGWKPVNVLYLEARDDA